MQLPTVFSTEPQPHTFPLSEVAKKRCSSCNDTKPLTEFYKNSSRADGLSANCKECQRAFQAKYDARVGAKKRQQQKRSKKTTTKPKQEKTVRMKPWQKKRDRTSVTVTFEQMERIQALRNRLGFGSLSDVVAFALDTTETNAKAIEIAKARADLEAAEQRLRILSMDAAPIASGLTKVPVSAQKTNGTHGAMIVDPNIPRVGKARKRRPNGLGVPKGTKVTPAGTRLCSRQGCTRPTRGKYRQCIHHRREARDYQRRMAKRRARLRAISVPPGGTLETSSFMS